MTTNLPGPLVSASWLADHLDDAVVVDVRWYLDGRSGRAAYEGGHIPTAVWADLDSDLSDPPGLPGGRHPLPSPERFAEAMGRLGVGDGDIVVAYDDASGMVAGRLWWMLDSLGERAAVLDGGITAWADPLVTEASVPPAARFTSRPWPEDRFVAADDVATRGERTVLVDARAASRYRGEENPIDPRFGHIPGARSGDWSAYIDNEGHFRPPEELAAHYAELGIDPETDVIAYCGSGVSACADLLALRTVGNTSTRLYTGSWSEWGADDDRPIETGD